MNIVERATRQNFCPRGYLYMNADVAAHAPGNGGNDAWAWRHFSEHGEREERSQLTAAFMAEKDRHAKAKFKRFGRTLATNALGMRNFKFRDRKGEFPISFSDRHFSRDAYQAESTNPNYGPFVQDVVANPEKLYLDLGCGLRNEVHENCLYLEVYPSPTADVIVEPNCQYPFRSQSFDGIGCIAVLEHVTKPWQVVAEIRRMLKPGGKAYIAWPFLAPVHGYPSHYYNATREGLKLLFADGFDIDFCGTEPFATPDYTITWILALFLHRLPAAEQERVRAMTVADLVSHAPTSPFWTDLLSKLSDEATSELACGNSLIATKR
jgi:SAM-dependent methyltransferase